MTHRVDSEEPYRVLWAKSNPIHPLWKHLLDAAAVSLGLPNPLSAFGWSNEDTALIVGLHDVGKTDPYFQHQVPALSTELERKSPFKRTSDSRCRHERLSAQFIRESLRTGEMSERDADTIGRAIVAHHGYWDEAWRLVPSPYKEAQEELSKLLGVVIGVDRFPTVTPENHSAFGMRLAGHVVLCDWIASNEDFFRDPALRDLNEPAQYFAAARTVARKWVRDLGLERDARPGKPWTIVDKARPIQQKLLDTEIPPGLVIIEAPMGEGKTEAAWILAEKWRGSGYKGMYMALPTMATSDSLYRRYRDDYLGKLGAGEDARLVHGMAWLRDEKELEKEVQVGEPGDDASHADAWFRPTRRAMLAAHGVGTIDQAMLAGMNVRFGFLRLHGLADRVLVIDEVHAYDAYMSGIICRLLQWCACLKIPAILLSATLSAKQREAMIEAYGATGGDLGADAPYPFVTVVEPGGNAWTIEDAKASLSRTLKIENHFGLLGEAKKTAAEAVKLVREGGCCCAVLNTVKQAQAVYQALNLDDSEKMLFHARFTAEDRSRITDQVLAKFGKGSDFRPARFVLVATQVVEQSLDVDFDYMISEIAPVDLLLQRSGRIKRHARDKNGRLIDGPDQRGETTLHVLLPEEKDQSFGGTGHVYADKPLLRSLAILASQSEMRLPGDFRTLIERCYGSKEWEQTAMPWGVIREADQGWDRETQLLHSQGMQFALCEPSKRVFRPVNNDPTGDDSDDGNGWRAGTRVGANDRTAVLLREEELQRLEAGDLPMEQVRALYRRSLKLPAYVPMDRPVRGYCAGVVAKGRLSGLVLLPLSQEGLWQGVDEGGNRYQVQYDRGLGLLAGRMQ